MVRVALLFDLERRIDQLRHLGAAKGVNMVLGLGVEVVAEHGSEQSIEAARLTFGRNEGNETPTRTDNARDLA